MAQKGWRPAGPNKEGVVIERQRVSSGSPWEDVVGYCRALRVGTIVEVSGTTAVDDQGRVVGPGDPYEQTRYILSKIAGALAELGVSLDSVVRTRIFVTDISRWEEVARAHGEYFAAIKPVASMVEVSRLIAPELLIEIEASAIV